MNYPAASSGVSKFQRFGDSQAQQAAGNMTPRDFKIASGLRLFARMNNLSTRSLPSSSLHEAHIGLECLHACQYSPNKILVHQFSYDVRLRTFSDRLLGPILYLLVWAPLNGYAGEATSKLPQNLRSDFGRGSALDMESLKRVTSTLQKLETNLILERTREGNVRGRLTYP